MLDLEAKEFKKQTDGTYQWILPMNSIKDKRNFEYKRRTTEIHNKFQHLEYTFTSVKTQT